MFKVLNAVRFVVCLVLLAMVGHLAYQVVTRSNAQQSLKYDYANISHMKYSLFSVNEWKKKIAGIVSKEIQNFEVDGSSKELLKKHIEAQLDILIDKVNDQIKESNKQSTNGWLKQQLMDMLVNVEDIKKGIPTYADALINKMTDEETQADLKNVLKKKVSSYIAKTYDKQESAELDDIVKHVGAKNVEDARAQLSVRVPAENKNLMDLSLELIAVAVVLFALAGFHRGRKIAFPYFFICWSALVILLYAGVNCPMIDMDAKVAKFGFVLLGHSIEFTDLTVYFQSKSILDVFIILITHAKIEMRIVGVLMILFSVVFPVLKLSTSILYYYDVFGAQRRSLMKAIVLKSGKWSMADVLVVAILMAYIGFNGMVTTQMGIIAGTFPKMEFISTNGTTLQFGFYIFLTYAILAMFFSGMSKKPVVE